MTLIDLHSHFLTPSYVEAARSAGHTSPDGMPGWPDWDPARHLALMDECGITTSLLSVSSPGTHFGDDRAARRLSREVNEAGASLRADHPDRFGHLASLPLPDVDGALAEAVHALDELGSDGVTVETNANGRYLGDPAFAPLWAELDRRRAVVLVHPTSPPHAAEVTAGRPRPMLEFVFDTARSYTDLMLSGTLTRFPGVRWIATHCGGALPALADRIELFRTAFGDGGRPGARPAAVPLVRHRRDPVPAPGPGPGAHRRSGTAGLRQRLVLDAGRGRARPGRLARHRSPGRGRPRLARADHRQCATAPRMTSRSAARRQLGAPGRAAPGRALTSWWRRPPHPRRRRPAHRSRPRPR